MQTLREIGAMVSAQIDFQKRQRDLEERGAIVDAVFEDSGVAAVLYTVEGKLVRASSAMCHLLGRTEESLCSEPHLLHMEDRANALAARELLLSGARRRVDIEGRFLSARGTSARDTWEKRSAVASLARDSAGGVRFVLLTLTSS